MDSLHSFLENFTRALLEPIFGRALSTNHPLVLSLITWFVPAAAVTMATAVTIAALDWWRVQLVREKVRKLRAAGDERTFIVLVGDFSGIGGRSLRVGARDTAKVAIEAHLGSLAPALSKTLHVFVFPRQHSRRNEFGLLLRPNENAAEISALNDRCKASLAKIGGDLFVTGERGEGIVNLLIVPAGNERTQGGKPEILSLADRDGVRALTSEAIAVGAAIAAGLDPASSQVLAYDNITADELDLLTRKLSGLATNAGSVFNEQLRIRVEDAFEAAMKVAKTRLFLRADIEESWFRLRGARAHAAGLISQVDENGISIGGDPDYVMIGRLVTMQESEPPGMDLYGRANAERALGMGTRSSLGESRLREAVTMYHQALSMIDLRERPTDWAVGHCHITAIEYELDNRDKDRSRATSQLLYHKSKSRLIAANVQVEKKRAPEASFWLNLGIAQCAMKQENWSEAMSAALESRSCVPDWAPLRWAQASRLYAEALFQSGCELELETQIRKAIEVLQEVATVMKEFASYDKVALSTELGRAKFALIMLDYNRGRGADYLVRLEEIVSLLPDADLDAIRPKSLPSESVAEQMRLVVSGFSGESDDLPAYLAAYDLLADSYLAMAELALKSSERRNAALKAATYLHDASDVAEMAEHLAFGETLRRKALAAESLAEGYAHGK